MKVLKPLLVPKMEEVTGEWRRLHNKERYVLYFSPNIIRAVMESRRMRWAGYVARMGDRRSAYRVLVGRPERRPLEDVGVDGSIILK
jgi:hypothetical protein